MCQDSIVGVAKGYGMDSLGIELQLGEKLFSPLSRPVRGLIEAHLNVHRFIFADETPLPLTQRGV